MVDASGEPETHLIKEKYTEKIQKDLKKETSKYKLCLNHWRHRLGSKGLKSDAELVTILQHREVKSMCFYSWGCSLC